MDPSGIAGGGWDAADKYLRCSGIGWLFVGLALCAVVWIKSEPENAGRALIPVAVGLAKLLFYKLTTRRSAADTDSKPPTLPSLRVNAMACLGGQVRFAR